MKKILGINTNVSQKEISIEHPDENDKIKYEVLVKPFSHIEGGVDKIVRIIK